MELPQTKRDPRDLSYKRESEKALERYKQSPSTVMHYGESVGKNSRPMYVHNASGIYQENSPALQSKYRQIAQKVY